MALSDFHAERPPWLARLLVRDVQVVAGAGILVSRRHVLTCAHVVGLQVGREAHIAGIGQRPDQVVRLEFPFAGAGVHTASVVSWHPLQADGDGDLAVLRLDNPLSEALPAPLAIPAALRGHRFSTHGFPLGDRAAREATGVLKGASGQTGTWVQLEADSTVGWPVQRRFSGSPVYDLELEAVVGIVALMDEYRSGHMLPMRYVHSLWPKLRVDEAPEPRPAEPPVPELPRQPATTAKPHAAGTFEVYWSGRENGYSYMRYPDAWKIGAAMSLLAPIVGILTLPIERSSEVLIMICFGLILFVLPKAFQSWDAYTVKNRMDPWSLRIGPSGIEVSGRSGEAHVEWDLIAQIAVTDIKADPTSSGSFRAVYSGIHVKLNKPKKDLLSYPAGWPVTSNNRIKRNHEQWQVICILGAMTRDRMQELKRILKAYAGPKLVRPDSSVATFEYKG